MTSTRFASIDIGTNSCLLLIVQRFENGRVAIIEEQCLITRLGKGIGSSRRLLDTSIADTLAALETFRSALQRNHVKETVVVGTAALREAENASDFIKEAEVLLGTHIEIISGRREAELVWLGVRQGLPLIHPTTLVFDVGGGSTEFILVSDGEIENCASLKMGSVRLTEQLIKHDPPMSEEIASLSQVVQEKIQELPFAIPRGILAIGTAGTVTTFATLEMRMERYQTELVNGFALPLENLQRQIDILTHLPLSLRRTLPGLEPARADVILAGGIIVREILKACGVTELIVSDRGVRWGRLYEQLISHQRQQNDRS